MATALTPSPSSNNKQWWPRLLANKESSPYPPPSNLYSDISSHIVRRPHTGAAMTSVTNSSPTSPNAFTVSSKSPSRFNLAAVIGFGSRSKKQQPVDIQEPPAHLRSLLASKSNTSKEFNSLPRPLASPDHSLSHGLPSFGSGTSRASTDGPLTPADDPSSPSPSTSYQHSLMTLTDTDPFNSVGPLNDRRLSAHSDKSLSRRLMQKIDGKSTKANTRLPMGEGPKREGRDRSATLPTRARTSGDSLDAYQPLRAVEPPWATFERSESHYTTSPRAASKDHLKSMRGISPSTTLQHSKSSKAPLPWPQTQVAREKGSSQAHQRKHSSSSISKEPLTDIRHTHTIRPSISSSSQVSQTSTMVTSNLSINHTRPKSGSEQPADPRHIAMPSPCSANTLPILPTHVARTNPRPPPTAELPPTPTLPQTSGSSSPARLYLLSSPFPEHHPLRSRSGTAASASSVSFASSLSSLSFTSRPSPQDPPIAGAFDYPSLLNETLPVTGAADDAVSPRGYSFRSSHNNSKAKGPALPPKDTLIRNDQTSKLAKAAFPRSQPLPSPPPSEVFSIKRERALSAAASSSEGGKMLRKQRSFHNTSHKAPAPLTPTLRHCSSFDPYIVPGSEDPIGSSPLRSPPLPPLRSPSLLSPPQDSPPLPPLLTSIAKRASAGKDLAPTPSPRRKLFGANRHDRDKERGRERKQELDHVDTTITMSTTTAGVCSTPGSALAHASSWFDDRGTSSEPASASSASPSTTHDVAQHIVPPAELLRLGAAWERENEGRTGLRRTKSSWGSRDSDISHISIGSSSSKTLQNPLRKSSSPIPGSGSKLPRSASLLSKASSAPSFGSTHRASSELSFSPSGSPLPLDSYTSLSPPPPRRQHRSISRMFPQSPYGFPPRGAPSTSASSGSAPPKGALIERKPSFLDMTTTRQSVTIDLPSDHEEYERDSFLELSRGMDSIDTIRESISSVDSFMQ